MSSRVNLGLLVDHINSLPETFLDWQQKEFPFLEPNLKFKILQSCAARGARPPISSHISKCFFSLDVSAEELKKLGRQSLRSKVDSAFEGKVSAFPSRIRS